MAANPPNPAKAATETIAATLHINHVKLYLPVYTLSIKNITVLQNINH